MALLFGIEDQNHPTRPEKAWWNQGNPRFPQVDVTVSSVCVKGPVSSGSSCEVIPQILLLSNHLLPVNYAMSGMPHYVFFFGGGLVRTPLCPYIPVWPYISVCLHMSVCPHISVCPYICVSPWTQKCCIPYIQHLQKQTHSCCSQNSCTTDLSWLWLTLKFTELLLFFKFTKPWWQESLYAHITVPWQKPAATISTAVVQHIKSKVSFSAVPTFFQVKNPTRKDTVLKTASLWTPVYSYLAQDCFIMSTNVLIPCSSVMMQHNIPMSALNVLDLDHFSRPLDCVKTSVLHKGNSQTTAWESAFLVCLVCVHSGKSKCTLGLGRRSCGPPGKNCTCAEHSRGVKGGQTVWAKSQGWSHFFSLAHTSLQPLMSFWCILPIPCTEQINLAIHRPTGSLLVHNPPSPVKNQFCLQLWAGVTDKWGYGTHRYGKSAHQNVFAAVGLGF